MKSRKLRHSKTDKLKFYVVIAIVCILTIALFFVYFKQPTTLIEKDDLSVKIEDIEARQDLLDKLTSGCLNKITDNSDKILKFMSDNLEITKDDVSKKDVEKFFCVDCLKTSGNPKINTKTGNFEIFYTYHNRYFSDRSFDEFVTCVVNQNFEVVKLYVRAGVSHAS